MFTLPEYEIIIEDEKIEPDTAKLSNSDEAELKEFERILKAKNPTFQNDETINESLEQSVSDVQEDKMFFKFKEKIASYPDQVLRYGKGENPLWVSDSNMPSSVPNCEYCGSKRRFEFQVNFLLLIISNKNLLIIVYLINRLCLKCSTICDWTVFRNKELTGVLCLFMFVKRTATAALPTKMNSYGNKIFLDRTLFELINKHYGKIIALFNDLRYFLFQSPSRL